MIDTGPPNTMNNIGTVSKTVSLYTGLRWLLLRFFRKKNEIVSKFGWVWSPPGYFTKRVIFYE
jgi:hypothetical protein